MPDAQGTEPLAKADTVLYCTSVALATDLSQYGDGLTADTTAAYELTSSLRGLDGSTGRNLWARVSVQTTDKNVVILAHASTSTFSSNTYAISIDGSYNIVFQQGATTLLSVAPALGATSSLGLSWCTRENPDTTGASDALISEFSIYNFTAGAYIGERTQVTHAIPTTNAGWALTVGGWYNAGAVVSKSGQVASCRIGKAFYPSAEVAEDWIAARSAHSPTVPTVLEPVPITVASGLADESEWAGMGNVGYCARQADQTRGRMLTDLVNEVYHDARTLTNTPSPTQWLIAPPGGSVKYRLDATRIRWVPHPGVARAWVRVHVQSWVTAGVAVPIGVRCYAMNRPHIGAGLVIEGSPAPALDFEFVQATLTINHGSGGAGQWLDLGMIRLPRFDGSAPTWSGTLTLCLAHAFDPANVSANDANARLKIKAWHVRPVLGIE